MLLRYTRLRAEGIAQKFLLTRENSVAKNASIQPVRKRQGPYTIDGHVFKHLKDAAAFYGLVISKVGSRLKNGWSLEEALGINDRNKSKYQGMPVVVGGTSYRSVKAAGAALKIDYKLVHSRLQRGYSLDEAFGLKSVDYSSKPKSVVVGDLTFLSLREACKHYDVDKDTLSARINRYGWSIGQALGVEPRPAHKKDAAGIIYSITNKINKKKYIGVTMTTVEQRWKQHIDKALSKKRMSALGLHHEIKMYGHEAFQIQEIATAKSLGELNDLEVKFIKQHKTLSVCPMRC